MMICGFSRYHKSHRAFVARNRCFDPRRDMGGQIRHLSSKAIGRNVPCVPAWASLKERRQRLIPACFTLPCRGLWFQPLRRLSSHDLTWSMVNSLLTSHVRTWGPHRPSAELRIWSTSGIRLSRHHSGLGWISDRYLWRISLWNDTEARDCES
jgi:hypothetical protein